MTQPFHGIARAAQPRFLTGEAHCVLAPHQAAAANLLPLCRTIGREANRRLLLAGSRGPTQDVRGDDRGTEVSPVKMEAAPVTG